MQAKTLTRGEKQMLRPTLASAAMVLAGSASAASTCEDLRGQIEAKLRAAGVLQYTLRTMDASAAASGKIVGTCDQGAKKIVYTPSGSTAGAPSDGQSPTGRTAKPSRASEPILTECKDGTVSVGGECKK